jgi:sigma-B regulation protein RsbU (phosphoserine phosphatase)
MADADYQETELQLAPGDRLLFYTDGIVEAMNDKEEIFGFERLLSVVQQSEFMDADSLLKQVLNEVNAFAGNVSQHDDLTVIAVSVKK